MTKTYIVAAKRTAIGKFLGTTLSMTAADLGAAVIKNIIAETGVNPANIDEVIVGNVLSAGQGQGVARQASIKGGIPQEVPAYGINMICGSGMKAVLNGVTAIKSGLANLIIAGGTESMSNAGYILPARVRDGHKMGDVTVVDHMVYDGLTDAFEGYHMGITAENIAEKYAISREEQDEFAIESQQRAIAAIDNGKFKSEIVPIEYKVKKETHVFDTDEFPNRTTSLEKLSTLRPAFKKEGSVTAGNASGINDGASFVLIASEEAVNSSVRDHWCRTRRCRSCHHGYGPRACHCQRTQERRYQTIRYRRDRVKRGFRGTIAGSDTRTHGTTRRYERMDK